MESDEKQIKKATEAMAETISDQNSDEFNALLKKSKENSLTPKDILAVSDEKAESVYAQAYRLYNTGRYWDAITVFRYLIMLDAYQAKYTLGIAACYHMLKEYQAAAETYFLCSVLDPTSPIPAFHASDCYLQLTDKASALIFLDIAIKKAGNKPEYKILKDRAEISANTLKKEFSHGGPEKNPTETQPEESTL